MELYKKNMHVGCDINAIFFIKCFFYYSVITASWAVEYIKKPGKKYFKEKKKKCDPSIEYESMFQSSELFYAIDLSKITTDKLFLSSLIWSALSFLNTLGSKILWAVWPKWINTNYDLLTFEKCVFYGWM